MAFARFTLAKLAFTTGAAMALADFEPGAKWEICIHKPIKHSSVDDIIPKEATVFDIDLSHAEGYPKTIPVLKEAGKTVLCYFNAGAMQDWDEDKDDFPEAVKGKTLGGSYDDEWYVDIRDSRTVDIMKKRLDKAVAAGCDGVDPDNVDAWAEGGEDPTGFNLKPEDYASYLTTLADYAHSLSTESGGKLLVGQKNAPAIASSLASALDFAVLESCLRDDFCGDFQRYVNSGKPVFQIEYPPSIKDEGSLSDKDKQFYCEENKKEKGDQGFSKVLKLESAQLDGWGQYCGGKSFEQPTINE